MQQINFKLLNGGYYALMIDGEEIGVVYKQEHALIIELASMELPKMEYQIKRLEEENEELVAMNDRLNS